ncbi:hypothetical protein SAY87_009270 [Trapa incisa]|uniref:CHHC U11-48K-type domain-containing protein n=1 Tax=Trapa incisa TaxID=236973 RepID=A0AAN7K1F0_9MYRT|nr:hypothetical protein SAY87_009270 [Trapa incisa]
MNPSPFPHSSRHFTSSASIPNPSPPPPNPCAVASDLSATLANLKSLITLSEQTLTSLSTLLPLNPHKEDHVPCPFNPHHRMPPEALFSHHLRCPFNLDLGHAVESLNYPKTLKSSAELAEESSFVQALPDSNADLYFTLDEYIDFRESLNFFYKDCPGVVSFPTDGSSNKRNFTLPGFLSVECANFFTDGSTDIADVNAFHIQLFPSEFWWVQNEVTGWTDYPSTCSYYVVYALSGVGIIRESDLRRLVIVNSPRTGIVIDVAMTDHITVLLSLCLKAIAKESLGLMKSRNSKFNCPILVQAATWLTSQLRILYGEMSGKSFAIDLLKKCLLDAASRLSVHSFEQKLRESRGENSTSQDIDLDAIVSNAWDVDLEKPVKQKVNMMNDSVNSRVIFLSQVAAAIAALHERFVLEVKIRALRQSQHVPRYQQ